MQIKGTLGAEGAATLGALALAASPAAHVRIVLGECARRGMDFDAAWALALRTVPRADGSCPPEWRETLRWAKPHYARAYAERAGVDPRSAALAV